MIAYVVSYETRDPIGRIVEEVDSVYLTATAARARARAINTDPVTYVNMVAGTESYPLRDHSLGLPSNPGRTNSSGKFTSETVREARRRYALGERMTDLAAEFNVSRQAMSRVIHGRTWANV